MANRDTESLTQRNNGAVSVHFPENGIYEGQQRSIIHCRQSVFSHYSIYFCLRLLLHCRVHHHHKKKRHQDPGRLSRIVNDRDYEHICHIRSLIQLTRWIKSISKCSCKASEQHTHERGPRCFLECIHPRIFG